MGHQTPWRDIRKAILTSMANKQQTTPPTLDFCFSELDQARWRKARKRLTRKRPQQRLEPVESRR